MSETAIKFGSFSVAGCVPFAGIVLDDVRVVAVEALRPVCRALDLPLSGAATLAGLLGDWDRNLASIRAVLSGGLDALPLVPLNQLRRHAPVPMPGQIVCVGANYRKHVIDLLVAQGSGAATDGQSIEQRREAAIGLMNQRAATGVPYAWVKANSTVAGPDDDLIIPSYTAQPDWELELAVVIGKPAFHVSKDHAMEHVAGYMIANDVTARDWVYRRDDMKILGTDWLVGKSAPGFLPTGPYLVAREDVANPHDLAIRLTINEQVMQDERTSDMIFGIERQIEYITSHNQLMPGDIVCTGSPAGNGAHHDRYLRDGDVMIGSITGLGSQHVRCVAG